MFNIGQIVTKDIYTQAAIWCNANAAHIEAQDGQYVIVANPEPEPPTVEEQVAALEASTGLIRPLRELVLAEGSNSSEYAKAKAQEIEVLAQSLRSSAEPAEEADNAH